MSEEEEATEVDVRDQVRDLERRLQIAEQENARKEEVLQKTFRELERAGAEVQSCQRQMDRYAAELESAKLQCELEKHRALECLREEHASQLKFMQTQVERERERTDNWVTERESCISSHCVQSLITLVVQHDPEVKPECQHARIPGSHIDPSSYAVYQSGAQTISETHSLLGEIPSQTFVSQASVSKPVYTFTQNMV